MIVGIAIALADQLFTSVNESLASVVMNISLWKTLIAAFYGGIVEELLMRLFLVSLFAWLLSKLLKKNDPSQSPTIMWTAIILSSIIFGIGHLPATASVTAITSIVVLRAIVLNGIGGLVFGWLFWKKGLYHAMVAHFVADIVLLVVMPRLLN